MILNNQSLKVYKYKEKQHTGQSDAQSSIEQKKFEVSKDFY
jgi:hypothetical protein